MRCARNKSNTLHKQSSFSSPVVSSTDDPLVVEPYAPHQLLVSFKDPQAGATLDVPKSARVN